MLQGTASFTKKLGLSWMWWSAERIICNEILSDDQEVIVVVSDPRKNAFYKSGIHSELVPTGKGL